MAVCCAQAFFIWQSTCPTFEADPPAGLIEEQKGVTRHIPQPEMPHILPIEPIKNSFPDSNTATQPPKMPTTDEKIEAVEGQNLKMAENMMAVEHYLFESRVQIDTHYDELAKRLNELTESTDVHFYANSLSAGLVESQLLDGRADRGYVQNKQGTMITLAARVSTDVLAGTITVEIEKNGTLTGFQVILSTEDPTFNVETVEPGEFIYDAGDILAAVVTTSADLSPTPNLDVSLGLVHG